MQCQGRKYDIGKTLSPFAAELFRMGLEKSKEKILNKLPEFAEETGKETDTAAETIETPSRMELKITQAERETLLKKVGTLHFTCNFCSD